MNYSSETGARHDNFVLFEEATAHHPSSESADAAHDAEEYSELTRGWRPFGRPRRNGFERANGRRENASVALSDLCSA